MRYSLGHSSALVGYADVGCIEIGNNAADRTLRAVALGCTNCLFVRSNEGGNRAAALYTLTGTAKPNGFDPEAYLRHVLEQIAAHPIKHIADLLPRNVRPDETPPDTPSSPRPMRAHLFR